MSLRAAFCMSLYMGVFHGNARVVVRDVVSAVACVLVRVIVDDVEHVTFHRGVCVAVGVVVACGWACSDTSRHVFALKTCRSYMLPARLCTGRCTRWPICRYPSPYNPHHFGMMLPSGRRLSAVCDSWYCGIVEASIPV